MMRPRRRNFVLQRFQLWFVLQISLFALAFIGIFAIGFALWFHLVFREVLDVAGLLSGTYLEILQSKAQFGLLVLLSTVVSLLIATFYFGLIFSHRIAGPVYALLNHLDRCRDRGELLPMKLREGDQLGEIATKFNAMAERIKGA